MKIGELATAAQTPVETIRFYEREGLLPAPARGESSNYRVYEAHHVQRLLFIRRCRGLDMALDEVRTLLNFMDQASGDCSEVNQVLDTHIGHVSARIQELRALEKELKALRSHCLSGNTGPACGILQALAQPAATTHHTAPPPSAPHQHVGAVHRHSRRAKA